MARAVDRVTALLPVILAQAEALWCSFMHCLSVAACGRAMAKVWCATWLRPPVPLSVAWCSLLPVTRRGTSSSPPPPPPPLIHPPHHAPWPCGSSPPHTHTLIHPPHPPWPCGSLPSHTHPHPSSALTLALRLQSRFAVEKTSHPCLKDWRLVLHHGTANNECRRLVSHAKDSLDQTLGGRKPCIKCFCRINVVEKWPALEEEVGFGGMT